MDLNEEFTEINVKKVYPSGFVANVVRNVWSWQFADSEENQMKFIKFMDRRFLVDLAVVNLNALMERKRYSDVQYEEKTRRLLLDISLLTVGFMNTFDYGATILRIEKGGS